MSSTVYCYNQLHLGDCLISLHLIRALAKARVSRPFIFFCGAHYHTQLQEVVQDLPNILLESFDGHLWCQHGNEAVNMWKNSEDAWVNSPLRWDWSHYTLWHHGTVCRKLGFENPFTCREHLLFDYPALNSEHTEDSHNFHGRFLIINCEPCSGQFSPMAKHGSGYLDDLISELCKNALGTEVVTVNQSPHGDCLADCSISKIGKYSQDFQHHIMIATGPMWPTLNVHNNHNTEGRIRIAIMDNGEFLNMPGIIQCNSVEAAREILSREGLL